MMTPSAVKRLNPLHWLGLPALLCAGASLLLALPVDIAGVQAPEPVFALAPAFAWAIIRPSILPPFVLVALGIFSDVLWGTPLGLWPLCILGAYGLTLGLRRVLAGQGFWMHWAWFAAVCGAGFGIGWLLTLLVAGTSANLVGLGLQFTVTAALFPLAWLLIERYEGADSRRR